MDWYGAKPYLLELPGLSAVFGLLAFLDSAHPNVGLFVAYVGGAPFVAFFIPSARRWVGMRGPAVFADEVLGQGIERVM